MMRYKKLIGCLAMTSLLFVFGACSNESPNAQDDGEQLGMGNPADEPGDTTPEVQAPEDETKPQENLFVSKDGKFQIALPTEGNWQLETEEDGLVSFIDEDNGMLDVMLLKDADAESTVIPADQDAFTAQIKEDPAIGEFKVKDFKNLSKEGGAESYRAVVNYLENEPFIYGVTCAVKANGEAYVINGWVKSEAPEVLAAVEQAVDSFVVLK